MRLENFSGAGRSEVFVETLEQDDAKVSIQLDAANVSALLPFGSRIF